MKVYFDIVKNRLIVDGNEFSPQPLEINWTDIEGLGDRVVIKSTDDNIAIIPLTTVTDITDENDAAYAGKDAFETALSRYLRPAVDTNIQDQTTPTMMVKFNKILSSTTTVGTVAIGDTTVELTDDTDAAVGRYLIFFNVTAVRYMVAEITDISATPIVKIDRPFDFAYPAGTFVDKTTTNMAVDGTLDNPVVFGLRGIVSPPGVALTVDVTRFIFSCITSSPVDLSKFANLPKLINGLLFRRRDGRFSNIVNVKNNLEIAGAMLDWVPYAATNPSQGIDGFTARLTFTGPEKIGVALRITLGEDIEALVQDLLATGGGANTITSLEIMAEGHEVQ